MPQSAHNGRALDVGVKGITHPHDDNSGTFDAVLVETGGIVSAPQLAPFSSKQERWYEMACVNIHTGAQYKLGDRI